MSDPKKTAPKKPEPKKPRGWKWRERREQWFGCSKKKET